MTNILAIIAGLLWAAKKYYNKKELERAQAEADKVQDDPAAWFRDHFRVPSDSSNGDEAKASDTKAGKGNRS